MRAKILLAAVAVLALSGCAPANIMASKWDTGINGSGIQTRCEEVDMRSNTEMNKLFSKYDGWKLVYLSEYTTGNKVGTSGAACFEHAK